MRCYISLGVLFAVLAVTSSQSITGFGGFSPFGPAIGGFPRSTFPTGPVSSFDDPRGRSSVSFGDSPQYTLGSMRHTLPGGSAGGQALATDRSSRSGSLATHSRTSRDRSSDLARSRESSAMQDLPESAIGPDGRIQEGYIGAVGGRDGFPVMGGVGAGEAYADGGLSMGVGNGIGTGSLRAFEERRLTGRPDPFAATMSLPPPGVPPLPPGFDLFSSRRSSARETSRRPSSSGSSRPPSVPASAARHDRVGSMTPFAGGFPGSIPPPLSIPPVRPFSPPVRPRGLLGGPSFGRPFGALGTFGVGGIGVGLGTPLIGGMPSFF